MCVAAGVAGGLLLLRGIVGLALLGVGLLRGTSDPSTPVVLLVIEPWFVAGGLAYSSMAWSLRNTGPGRDGQPSRRLR